MDTLTLDPNSETQLQRVMPWLADRVRQMADILAMDAHPIKLIVSAGLRTWAVQDALYNKGRTMPGKIVTDAEAGYSWHNFGCAVDCEPEVKDGTIDWNGEHWQWKRMEAVGTSLGLSSGANWKRIVDAPHFQYTKPYPEDAPNEVVRSIYLSESLEGLWNTIII